MVAVAIAFGLYAPTLWVGCVLAASLFVIVPPRHRRAVVVVLLSLLAAASGASVAQLKIDPPLAIALGPTLDSRTAPPVLLSGVLREDAVANADEVALMVDVDRVKVSDVWRDVRGRAQLSVGGVMTGAAVKGWTRGRRIVAPVLVKRPQVWLNPGGPSVRWQTLRRPFDILGSVKSASLIDVTRGSWLAELGARVRRHVRESVRDTVGRRSAESAAVVTAILIGDRTGLTQETIRGLQMAGTYHVIAISGGNIAIVVMLCLWVLRWLIPSPRGIAIVTMAVVLAYGGVVTDQASVSRAVTAAVVVLGLEVFGLRVRPLRIFFLVALLVTLGDPLTVVDVGAWLSFGATLGILLLAGPILNWLPGAQRPRYRPLLVLLAATIAAELALVPISAAVFSRVGIAGLFLNFAAIPAMAVAEVAGGVAVLVSRVWPAAATVPGIIADLGARALLRSADFVAIAPWLSWQTPPVSPMWIAGYYGAGLAACAWSSRVVLQRVAIGTAAIALVVIVCAPNVGAPHASAGWLRIAVLDVGQGDSIVVQFPTGQSLLVDAGGTATAFDVGSRIVRPALWGLGIRQLDWLALTHGDVDHAGGAGSVLRDLHPREVWEGVPVWRDAPVQTLRANAQVNGAAWRRLVSGQSFEVGSVLVEVLNPPAPDWERQKTRNDDSIVLRVRFGSVAVWLTGDISRAIEAALPAEADRSTPLRILKVPHHGSRTSSSAPFLHQLLPHVALVSAGRGNTFGHPAPDVLARYEQLGVEVFRTDRDGAIIIDTDGRDVDIRTMTGRTYRLSYDRF